MQVVARSVETALHKLHEIGYDLHNVVSGFGAAPLPPVAADDLVGIGRTNDAILYGGEVTLWVKDDDRRLATALKRGLEGEGFAVDVAFDGEDGLWHAQEHSYDALVLDVMLPGMDGLEVCARLRAAGNWAPILMLTARGAAKDEADALDTGADDFLSKPFSYVVLVARLRA